MLTLTLSRGKGIGGSLKQSADSFVVKEIAKNGIAMSPGVRYSAADLGEVESNDGKFVKFVLQKKNWDSIHALQEIAKRIHRGVRSVGYAGMKDKIATTVQLASVFGAKAAEVSRVNIKDISINGAWQSSTGVEMGDLEGNAFEVTIEGVDANSDAIDGVYAELSGIAPNYFDRQRFGIRLNNHIVGMHIVKGEFEAAALEFLTGTSNETNEAALEARRRLAEEGDFKKALDYFPAYLRYERAMLAHLSINPGDFANAIRRLPRGISLLFVHALESYIFNRALEKRIESMDINAEGGLSCNADAQGFPDISSTGVGHEGKFAVGNIVGYDTKEAYMSSYEKEALEEIGISKDEFKIKSMPELSMKGAFRVFFSPFKDFSYSISENAVKMKFSLPAGSYATVLANEFMKNSCLSLDPATARS
ncbi:MAG: tRNA pseudouridine(13) synthase TruD [Candidatus Micrarchaeia archaeon]